jgi:hypothetical protein
VRLDVSLDLLVAGDGRSNVTHARVAASLRYVAALLEMHGHVAANLVKGDSGPVYDAVGAIVGTWRVR